jgi:kelch-like protein 8
MLCFKITFFSPMLFFRWELVGSVSHCRAGAGVAVCACLTSQIRDVGHGSSNVVDCMWFEFQPQII